jgi:propanol-preferring alcohol dehydrogenase
VFGVGGLGHLAIQYAAIAGATVAVVDRKLDVAKRVGASYTVNGVTQNPAAQDPGALGGADVASRSPPGRPPFEQAFRSLKRRGTLVLVALPRATQCTCRSSRPCSRHHGGGLPRRHEVDLQETFEPRAEGGTHIVRESRTLEEVDEAIEEVLRGGVDARLVVELRALRRLVSRF